tara:strand:- start:51 stop:722 length:672 start_codon:yes stop_codon:yes gene_type:complete
MIDPVWERKYAEGFDQRYPWDSVVSFVYRYAPICGDRESLRILEVGFGSGSNLWFAAREGISVSGIEGSYSAVSKARERFRQEGLQADLRQGDFTRLPFESNHFDLVIDRAAITHVGRSEHIKAIGEVRRVMKTGGFFHFNAYAEGHSSSEDAIAGEDGTRVAMSRGSLLDVGQVYFSTPGDINEFFAKGWKLHQFQRREWKDLLSSNENIHAEWMLIAEKLE